jgi:RNA polymerase-binding transcription factor DksA
MMKKSDREKLRKLLIGQTTEQLGFCNICDEEVTFRLEFKSDTATCVGCRNSKIIDDAFYETTLKQFSLIGASFQ